MSELTKLYPMVQFRKDTWEIDEFDCASMFLLVGAERALLIDCGVGLGDLRGAVEMITDKPVTVVITHNHLDHIGNAVQFEEVWMHPADQNGSIVDPLERKKWYTELIANRQKGCLGAPYTMFNLYPYDIDVDLRDPDPNDKMPIIHDLYDGQEFDLGGGRIVTAYHCPGHTPGEMVFIDSQTRYMFAGDAINYSLLVSSIPAETTLKYLKRLADMSDKYDTIYNGHHDFRAQGAPLDDDCLPNAIGLLEDLLQGNYSACQMAGGRSIPLRRTKPQGNGSRKTSLMRGRNTVNVDLDKLWEEKTEE